MPTKPFLFFFGHYGFLVLIGICAYGIGRRFTRKIRYDSPMEQISFCTALGLGFIAYLIFFMGTLRILYPGFALAALVGVSLLGAPAWKEIIQKASSRLQDTRFASGVSSVRWRPAIPFSLAAALLIPVLLMPLYPPTAFDSTMYHLAYAKIYTQNHGMTFTPYLRFPVSPQINEMLFTLAFLFYDDVSAQLIQFMMMGLLGLGLYAFGRRHFSQRIGIGAATLFLSNPMVLWLGASAYIDIGLAFFVTMATYSLFNWIHQKEKSWLVLGALLLGLAAGSKYTGLFFVILFALVVLYVGVEEKRPFRSFLFLMIVIAVASPWYFRNWYYTGNPFFPFFGQVFGYGSWSPQDLQSMLDNLMRTYGTGKGIVSLLLLPLNLTFNQPKFLMEAPLSPIYLFALPFLLFGLPISKLRGLFLIVLTYTLFWFSTAQLLRYLVPILPLLSLAAVASFEDGLRRLALNRVVWLKKGLASFIILILLTSPGWLYAMYKIRKEGYPPYTRGQRVAYLNRKLPTFPAYRYLNQRRGSQYSVYALFDENMAYFADGIFMGDCFGPGRFERVDSRLSDPQALHQELRNLGADHLLVRRNKLKVDLSPYFRLIYEDDHVLLFELSPEG